MAGERAGERLSVRFESAQLSAILHRPEAGSDVTLLLAHGAGAGFEHAHMQALSNALLEVGIGSMRFNFPFTEQQRRRADSKPVAMAAIAAARDALSARVDGPVVLAGHSFGGRMATHAVAELGVESPALVLFSFPLHPPKKPSIERAAHLGEVNAPMLFVNGTRDALAERALLDGVAADLGAAARVVWLEGADHGFHVRKRDLAAGAPEPYGAAAQAVSEFLSRL